MNGLPRIVVRGELVLIMVDQTGPAAAAAAAAERVEESRGGIEADKGGLIVSSDLFDQVIGVGSVDHRQITVTNSGDEQRTLMSSNLTLSHPSFKIRGPVHPLVLQPGQTLNLTIVASPSIAGVSRDILSLLFSANHDTQFSIGRFLEVRCGDAAVLDLLKPTAPYVKPKRRRRRKKEGVKIVGPPHELRLKEDTRTGPRLKMYDMSKSAFVKNLGSRAAVEKLARGSKLMQSLRGLVSDKIVHDVYSSQVSSLLFTEESQLVRDLSNFDLVEDRATVLTRRGGLLWLRLRLRFPYQLDRVASCLCS